MGFDADRKMNEDDWMNYALLWEALKYRALTIEEEALYELYEEMRIEFFDKVLNKLDEDTGIQHVILSFHINLNKDPESQVVIRFTEKADMDSEDTVGCICMSIRSLTDKDKVDNAFATAESYRQNDVGGFL